MMKSLIFITQRKMRNKRYLCSLFVLFLVLTLCGCEKPLMLRVSNETDEDIQVYYFAESEDEKAVKSERSAVIHSESMMTFEIEHSNGAKSKYFLVFLSGEKALEIARYEFALVDYYHLGILYYPPTFPMKDKIKMTPSYDSIIANNNNEQN